MKNDRPCIYLCLILQCPGKARCVCAGPPVQGLPLPPEYTCLHPCPASLWDTIPLNRHYTF